MLRDELQNRFENKELHFLLPPPPPPRGIESGRHSVRSALFSQALATLTFPIKLVHKYDYI